MTPRHPRCPDCTSSLDSVVGRLPAAIVGSGAPALDRRKFLGVTTAGALSLGAAGLPRWAVAADTPAPTGSAESLVKVLYDALSPEQRQKVCYDWDFQDSERGLLRTRVANNWQINEQVISSEFYTADQQRLIREIFESILNPDWHQRIDKQLEDDAGGYGIDQSIAIFGRPGESKFEFVMTGRHMTLRCDGNSAEHVAFGGPIFYGHAADGFNEGPTHPGNVFWPQALAVNKVFAMLDGKQRKQALVPQLPREEAVAFRGAGRPGITVGELSSDQKEELQKTLALLLEPYRQVDRDEVVACLTAQGGLDGCSLAFYEAGDLGKDQVWDCWRLEGPAFVWYFRGTPHVHVWVNVADDPSVALNA